MLRKILPRNVTYSKLYVTKIKYIKACKVKELMTK